MTSKATATKPSPLAAVLRGARGRRVLLGLDCGDAFELGLAILGRHVIECVIERVGAREVLVREGRVSGAIPIEHITSVTVLA